MPFLSSLDILLLKKKKKKKKIIMQIMQIYPTKYKMFLDKGASPPPNRTYV